MEQTQALYASIVDSSDDAIISKTLDGVITGWNRGAEILFGYSAGEIIGENISLLIPAELLIEEPEIIKKIKQGVSIKQHDTYRLKKDGKVVQVSVTLSPLMDRDGNVVGVSKIARNITERKAEQDKLQRTLKEINAYKYALDHSAIIGITDQKGIISHVNDNFCRISRYSSKELIGQDHRLINSCYHPKEFMRDLWMTIANGKVWKGELRNKTKDGSFYWVDTTIVPFLDEGGKPYQYLAIRVDITQRKKVEEEIKALNETLESKVIERTHQLQLSNKELEAFSYSVSHDLRAPLRAVSGYANMLQDGYLHLLDANGKRLLEIIQGNARRMGLLIDDLLAFSKLGKKGIRKSMVDMTALTSLVVDEIGKSTQHKAEIEIGTLHPAFADTILVKQVMSNYILNAVKYSAKKEKALIEIGSAEENGRVVYSVKDNGAGFDMQYVHKLFGVFQRLHSNEEFEGTGVGLAIVKRIINKHGGDVWAEGALEKGATFYFSLPGK